VRKVGEIFGQVSEKTKLESLPGLHGIQAVKLVVWCIIFDGVV